MKKKLMKKGLLLWVACFILSMCFIPFEAKAATDSAPKVEKRIVRYRSTYVNDKQVYLENIENGKITSRQTEELLEVKQRRARIVLVEMVNNGLLEKQGAYKTPVYVINNK